MAWLGEELEPVAEGDLAPRCVKDEIEEGLFARRRDLLTEATIEKDGKRVTTRTPVSGQFGRVFQAAGIALPPNWREHPD